MSHTNHIVKLAFLAALFIVSSSACADGFTFGTYIITKGDFDGDGDTDLHIRERRQVLVLNNGRSTTIPNLPKVVPFALLQGPNKSFVIDSDLTGLDFSSEQPATVYLRAFDVNLDGNLDSVVTNIQSVVTGAKDQIVFASPVEGDRNSPILLRAIDNAFQAFVEEVNGWFERHDYFEYTAYQNGWYTVTTTGPFVDYWPADYIQFWGFTFTDGVVIVGPNEDPYNPAVPPSGCSRAPCIYEQGVWKLYLNAYLKTFNWDYSHFNSDARAFAQAMETFDDQNDLVAGTADAIEISNVMQDVLGTQFMRNVLTDANARLEHEEDIPSTAIGDRRVAYLILLFQALKKAQETPIPEPEDDFVRMTGTTREIIVQKIPSLELGDLNQVHGVVLHRTGGKGILQNILVGAASSREGTHFWIDKNGDIYQTASLDKFTGHAGRIKSKCVDVPSSCTPQEHAAASAITGERAIYIHEKQKSYPDRYVMNEDSIGIEVVTAWHENTQQWDPVTQDQLDSINDLVEALRSRYGLTVDQVVGHDDIAVQTPGEGSGLGYD